MGIVLDVAQMRSAIRFFIRDPNGDALTDTELLDLIINPVMLEWWKRFERRPGHPIGTGALALNAGSRIVELTGEYQQGDLIESMVFNDTQGGVIRDEWSRVRYLQESEGATGRPRTFAMQLVMADVSPFGQTRQVCTYPIPDANYTLLSFGTQVNGDSGTPSEFLISDTDEPHVDPLASRMMVRLMAYQAAVMLGQPAWRLKAIADPLEEYIRFNYEVDKLRHGTFLKREDLPLFIHRPKPGDQEKARV